MRWLGGGSLLRAQDGPRQRQGGGGDEIFAAGKFAKQPEEKDASLKYVFTNRLVDAITVGMLTTDEVDDTLKRMSAVKA